MEIVQLTKKKHNEWNKFCQENDEAWFWHMTDWQDYILSYISESRPEKENLSFMVYGQDKLVAIVPLICENNWIGEKERKEFAYDGWVVPAPVVADSLPMEKRELIYELIFTEIDRLAKKNDIVRSKFGLNPFLSVSENKNPILNYLFQFGYLDVSLNTRIIDLRKPEKELWRELRRNHRRNILKSGQFKINFYTAKNINEKIFDAYKKMHIKAAGRQTRPDKTFEFMFDWIKQGLAFLAVAEFKNKQIGFEYYSTYKNITYGFSAANDQEYGHLTIRHKIEWQSILWMKQQGFSFYEIGLQQYGNLFYDFPSEKQINISHFKRGFGGFTAPIFMGEKYFDQNYFLEIYRERIKKFAENL